MESSWGTDWLGTVIQGLPKLIPLVRHMRPTIAMDSIASLDAAAITALGVDAIIWDIDGTLMRRHGTEVASHVQSNFTRLSSDPGLRHVILSNCDDRRFGQLARIFPTIAVLRVYQDDDGVTVRRRLGDDDRLTGGSPLPAHHGRHALRKPSVVMVRAALNELGCTAPGRALMVGDQYLTDIAPANMLGVQTVKVRTIDPASFPAAVRALQLMERLLLFLSRSPG